MVGNLERVLLTTPKALSEVLVHKAYDFCKPELVQLQLRRVTGNGLVLAEGDEHKVCLFLDVSYIYIYILTVTATTQKSYASIFVSSHQRSLSYILGQERRAGQFD